MTVSRLGATSRGAKVAGASPSLTAGTAMAVIWRVLFSGDQMGYINNLLMKAGLITEPIIFLQSSSFLLPVMILVGLWPGCLMWTGAYTRPP